MSPIVMACSPGQHTVKSYCRKARSRLGKRRPGGEGGESRKRRKVSSSAGTKRSRADDEGPRKRKR